MLAIKELLGFALLLVWWEGSVCFWYLMGIKFYITLPVLLILTNLDTLVSFGLLEIFARPIHALKKWLGFTDSVKVSKSTSLLKAENNNGFLRVIQKLLIMGGNWKYTLIFFLNLINVFPLMAKIIIFVVKATPQIDSNKGCRVLLVANSLKVLVVVGGVYIIGQPVIDFLYAIHIWSYWAIMKIL